jgi:hypothetical protein
MSKPNQAENKSRKGSSKSNEEQITFVFTRQNYRLLIIGVLVIALGLILMIGGGSKDPTIFSDKIFNFQRLTLAPILILAGFIIEIFAIMKRPKA